MDLKVILHRTTIKSGNRSKVKNQSFKSRQVDVTAKFSTSLNEGEKNHKKGGLNCVFGNFFLNVLDNCPQVQSLSEFRVYVQRIM